MQVILWGGGSACACEHMLDYINNPENILTLILHSFIRSLSNFRSCQIRPIFPILHIKLSTRRVFFQHPLISLANSRPARELKFGTATYLTNLISMP